MPLLDDGNQNYPNKRLKPAFGCYLADKFCASIEAANLSNLATMGKVALTVERRIGRAGTGASAFYLVQQR